jgi:hypothetical protein
MMDVEIAVHGLAIEGAGPCRVTAFQEPPLNTAPESCLLEKISHDLGVIRPYVGHIPLLYYNG